MADRFARLYYDNTTGGIFIQLNNLMIPALTPSANIFNALVTFNAGVLIHAPVGSGDALQIHGTAGGTGDFLDIFDSVGNPIMNIADDGGLTIYGDHLTANHQIGFDGQTNPPSIIVAVDVYDNPTHRMWFTNGNPTTAITAGTSFVNDICYDYTDAQWYKCTAGGAPGATTWSPIAGP